MEEKLVKVINENNEEIQVKQFQHRTTENQALVSIDKINSSIYHYWYDCYEDWPYEYVKDFVGWKIKALSQLSDCKECTRCKERDYRNAHPKAIITGYDFHYYFEDL